MILSVCACGIPGPFTHLGSLAAQTGGTADRHGDDKIEGVNE